MMKLCDASIDKTMIVLKIECDKITKNRLEKMGLTVGVKVKILRTAPLGDPVLIKLRGVNLALRKSLLRRIVVIND